MAGRTAPAPGSEALVIVAKFPREGQVKTRMAKGIGTAGARSLYEAFLRDLNARFSCGPRPLHWAYVPSEDDFPSLFDPGTRCFPQEGAGLGERLFNIFKRLFAAGHERVAVISSDAPHLPSEWVDDAFLLLREADAVFAPANDGGYNLVGLSGIHDVFSGITMSTATVLEETRQKAQLLGLKVRLLPALFDVDEAGDVIKLRDYLAGHAVPLPHTSRALDQLGLGVSGGGGGAAPGFDPGLYDDYLRTRWGLLRFNSALDNLLAAMAALESRAPLHVLDAGCGTGELACRLLARGHRVSLVDAVPAMLDFARQKVASCGLTGRAAVHQLDLHDLGTQFADASVDVAVCHFTLEYVDRPEQALAALVSVLRPGGLLSLLFRNRHGEILRHLLLDRNVAAATATLANPSFRDILFQQPGRLFTPDQIARQWRRLGITTIARHGIRVFSDYLPEECKAGADAYGQILELERKLGAQAPFWRIARYVQLIGRKHEQA